MTFTYNALDIFVEHKDSLCLPIISFFDSIFRISLGLDISGNAMVNTNGKQGLFCSAGTPLLYVYIKIGSGDSVS